MSEWVGMWWLGRERRWVVVTGGSHNSRRGYLVHGAPHQHVVTSIDGKFGLGVLVGRVLEWVVRVPAEKGFDDNDEEIRTRYCGMYY